jgi:Holliday junction DNA helicase RuvA
VIVRITGTLVEVGSESVTLERDGIAREVLTPGYAVSELAACRGRQVTLHTLEFLEGNPSFGHLTPRLLGFLHVEDRDFFTRFVSVKGIGFRKALKALTEPVARIAGWIEHADRKGLACLPGIGARAADLIIAELKGKMSALALGGQETTEPASSWTDAQRDALEILLAWGDGRGDVQRWLARAAQLYPDIESTDEWVRAAYKIKAGVES